MNEKTKILGLVLRTKRHSVSCEIRQCYHGGKATREVVISLDSRRNRLAGGWAVVLGGAFADKLPEGSWSEEILSDSYLFFVKFPDTKGSGKSPVERALEFLQTELDDVTVHLGDRSAAV